MLGYRLLKEQTPPEFQDVPEPHAGPGQVVVKVAASGLCHSDFHVISQAPSQTDIRAPGIGYDGGHAPYVIVPQARFLVRIGDLDPVTAAPLTDAGITTYSAIKPALPHIWPGSTAVVIGVGGLGLYAVQFLRQLTGARV